MKFKPGQIIDNFQVEKNGKKLNVLFRIPKMSDVKGATKYFNKLIGENALILAVKKKKLKEGKAWIKSLMKDIKNKKCVYIAVEVDKRFLGGIEITLKPAGACHIADIGMGLDKSVRELGIGTTLLKTGIDLAKKYLNAEIACIGCLKGNPAIHIYKKLGFKQCGYFPKFRKRGKQYHDEIIMYKFLK